MHSTDLVVRLRAAGDSLHQLAADEIAAYQAERVRMQTRIQLLEWVARLNGETVRSLQRAAAETSLPTTTED